MAKNKDLVITAIQPVKGSSPSQQGWFREIKGHTFDNTDGLMRYIIQQCSGTSFQPTLQKNRNEIWIHTDPEAPYGDKNRKVYLQHILTIKYSHENVANFNGFREYKNLFTFLLISGILADACTRFNYLEMGGMALVAIWLNWKTERKDVLKRKNYN